MYLLCIILRYHIIIQTVYLVPGFTNVQLLFQWRPAEWYSQYPTEHRRSSGPVCGLDPQ